ncbi:hypothetical protein [Thiolapillus sp.]
MPPILKRSLIIAVLGFLPLQQAQAFFCFKFAMGGKSGGPPPRHFSRSASKYAAPHPSYYLSHPAYSRPPTYPYSQPTSPLPLTGVAPVNKSTP